MQEPKAKINYKINQAMRDPERWAVRIVYRDDLGRRTRRIVSPTRWGASGRFSFLALCTGRQEQRWFKSASVEQAELVSSADVLMPTKIEDW
jgi:hypothetical protein